MLGTRLGLGFSESLGITDSGLRGLGLGFRDFGCKKGLSGVGTPDFCCEGLQFGAWRLGFEGLWGVGLRGFGGSGVEGMDLGWSVQFRV